MMEKRSVSMTTAEPGVYNDILEYAQSILRIEDKSCRRNVLSPYRFMTSTMRLEWE